MPLTRSQIPQRLWHDLVAACERAGGEGLNTDEMGYIVHEFALGLFALDFNKEELMTHLAGKLREIGLDELAVVNAGLGRSNPKAWSEIDLMTKARQGHPRLAQARLDGFLALRCYRMDGS